MIKIENLVKRYGSNYALNDVSLEIGEGEIVGLLGPNGAGKSTMMNILTGYLAATSGAVEIGGYDIEEEPMRAKAMIGFLPEQPPVYPDMTVMEYLEFVYELKGCTLEKEKHLGEILDTVKLRDVKGRLIKNLSKGYRQRVGIAQALIGDPKLIIFDEPTVGLDPKQILEVRNLIRTLGKKHTVILSTHILAEVQSVCERVIIINRGKIIADDRTENIATTLENGMTVELSVVGPRRDVARELEGVVGVRKVHDTGERDADAYIFRVESKPMMDIRKNLFYMCAKKSWPLLAMKAVGSDLETVFIRLVENADAQGV